MKAHSSILCLAAILLLACGGDEQGDDGNPVNPTPSWKNMTPRLFMASPGELAVGEKLTIYGEDFILPTKGHQVVLFNGNFVEGGKNGSCASGATGGTGDNTTVKTQPVNLQYKAKYVNARTLTWSMWPNIVFEKTGSKLGSFVGTVQLVNVGYDGSQRVSDRLPIKVCVKPSIILRIAKPTGTTCQPVVTKTIEGTGFAFAAEAVGLTPGTSNDPMTFYWTFMADQWNASWTYGVGTDFSSLWPKKGPFVVEESVGKGSTSMLSDDSDRSMLVKVGSDLLGKARLKVLKTGTVPSGGQSTPANVLVLAVDSKGKTARLNIPMEVAKMAQMSYDNKIKIAERYQPVMTTDCMNGGDIGRQVTYAEDKSESRSRGMSFSYNTSLGMNFAPIPSNPFALGINFSVGFGVDINAQMTTTKSKSLNISGQILPGEWGSFYRQTTRIHRTGKIIIRNKCGVEKVAGDAILTDWLYTPDLATGYTCPPKTHLPPAGKWY